jgi:hypothetical protein
MPLAEVTALTIRDLAMGIPFGSCRITCCIHDPGHHGSTPCRHEPFTLSGACRPGWSSGPQPRSDKSIPSATGRRRRPVEPSARRVTPATAQEAAYRSLCMRTAGPGALDCVDSQLLNRAAPPLPTLVIKVCSLAPRSPLPWEENVPAPARVGNRSAADNARGAGRAMCGRSLDLHNLVSEIPRLMPGICLGTQSVWPCSG